MTVAPRDAEQGGAPEVLGVNVSHYKNLRNMWFRWAPKSVVIGANGAGKTNLLECFALLMGTLATKELVARRIPQGLDLDISVVVREPRDVLTPPSAFDFAPASLLWESLPDRDKDKTPGPMRDFLVEARWLADLGAQPSDSLIQALLHGVEDPSLRERLADLLKGALGGRATRYRIVGSHEVREVERTLVVERSTLKDHRSAWAQVAALLPSPFRPLADWAERKAPSGHDPFLDVMRLPVRWRVPVELQWIPSPREDAEVVEDLDDALFLVWDALAEFGQSIDTFLRFELGTGWDEEPVDAMEWCVNEAQESVRTELWATMPHLDAALERDHSQENPWTGQGLLAVTIKSRNEPLGPLAWEDDYKTLEPSTLNLLSAGERRWMDEALAAAANTIRLRGLTAESSSILLGQLSGERLSHAGDEVRERVEDAWAQREIWGREVVATLLRSLAEEMSAAAGREMADRQMLSPFFRTVTERALPSWLPRRVRVFDEPEAHLHADSLRRVVDGLARMGEGADVLVASHHPQFIHRGPEWVHHHLRPGPTGRPVLSRYDAASRAKRELVAKNLGLKSGEIIANANGILFVEGVHDVSVINHSELAAVVEQANIIVVPLRGAEHLLAIPVFEFVLEMLHEMRVAILIDNTYEVPTGLRSHEQEVVARFMANMREQGRDVALLALNRPDIVAYLNETAVRRSNPDFTNWAELIREFRQARAQDFKGWLARNKHVNLENDTAIHRVLHIMKSGQLSLEPGLRSAIEGFCAATAGRPSDANANRADR